MIVPLVPALALIGVSGIDLAIDLACERNSHSAEVRRGITASVTSVPAITSNDLPLRMTLHFSFAAGTPISSILASDVATIT